ncbi:MAG: hypothetical protein ACM3WV_07160 [Bacillota bacterium]
MDQNPVSTFIGLMIAAAAGIMVGMDAEKRGMNPWGWGIFVFLLCIIGLPVYLIVRKPLLSDQGSTKNCPFCAETIQSDALKCKHCGSDLTGK